MNFPESNILQSLGPVLIQNLSEIETIPKPFCYNIKRVKAFVLGADPSNFSIEGKATKVLSTVFGIGEGDARYFSSILNNLKTVGLSLEDIYVQNLVRYYLKFETSKNHSLWKQFAEKCVPYLKIELDSVDKVAKTPVLVTAEVIFKFLHPNMAKYSAKELYNSGTQNNIQKLLYSVDNRLKRPVLPFYRNLNYILSKDEFKSYKELIFSSLKQNRISN